MIKFHIEEKQHIEVWWRDYLLVKLTYELMEDYASMFVMDLKSEMEHQIWKSFVENVPSEYHPRYKLDIKKASKKVTEWLENKAKETVHMKRLSTEIVNEPKRPVSIKQSMSIADAQELLACEIPQWFRDSLTNQVSEAYTPEHIKQYCLFCMSTEHSYKCKGHK